MSESSLVDTAIRKAQEEAVAKRAEARILVEPSSAPASFTARAPKVSLDAGRLRAAGLLAPEDEEAGLARQYRRIKRPVIDRALGTERIAKGYRVMIASATSGEGKTFTAVNLALSMSLEKDLRVLLVDADVAKPHISRVLGLTEAPGLLDALRDPMLDAQRLVLPTDVPTLSVLPAGRFSDEATELLVSRRMEQIAASLGEQDRHRIVLFDSCPLLQTNESHALAQGMGQIIVVVRAESTPQLMLLEALDTLKGHPCVSLVLNQSLRTAASPYYYYGYGTERAASVPSRGTK